MARRKKNADRSLPEPTAPEEQTTEGALGLSPVWRRVLGLLLALHVAAVFIGPFATPVTSPLGMKLREWFRPYIEAVDLDHGYKFFSPDPGPGNSFRVELKYADGRTEERRFPDVERQWPRLYYHRHMMLAEFLRSQFVGRPKRPEGILPGTLEFRDYEDRLAAYQRVPEEQKQISKALVDSYMRHLLESTGAEELTLFGMQRNPPTVEAYRRTPALDAPDYLEEDELGLFRRESP
jgi:hypothetical protein